MQLSWQNVALVILLVVGGAVYANSLSGAFVIDDRAAIVDNDTIRDLSDLESTLSPPHDSPVAGRPVPNFTFAVNYALGGYEVEGYHLVNIAVHLLCAMLLFLLLDRTLRREGIVGDLPAGPEKIAFATALLWVVHPLNSEVVVYITQRTESLAALLILATFYATLRSAESADAKTAWLAVAVACGWLGVFTKEVVAVLPLLVLGFDAAFLSGSWREALRERRALHAGLFASWLPLALIVGGGGRGLSVGFDLGVSVWTYLLNQARFLGRYLQLAVWPDSLVAFYGWPEALTLAEVWPQAALVVALLLVTVLALVRGRVRLGFLGAWCFILLAPTSSFVPITTEVAAERRMYLPLMALILLFVLLVSSVIRRLPGSGSLGVRTTLQASLCLLIGVPLALATVQRNAEYQSERVLAETLVERWPTGVAHHMLGRALMREGEQDGGLRHLGQAIEMGNSRAGAALARGLLDAGRADEALAAADAFLATAGPDVILSHRWLHPDPNQVVMARSVRAAILSGRQDWAGVEAETRAALALDPQHTESRILLADALFAQQRWSDAQLEYRRYLALDPDNAAAWVNLGISEVGLERPLEARDAFERAVEEGPDDPQSHFFLSVILWQLGDRQEAAEHAAIARDLGVRDPILDQILGEGSD